MKLIHVEVKVDPFDMKKAFDGVKIDTAVEILTILRSGYSDHQSFKDSWAVRQVAKLYGISLDHIQG